MNYMIFQRKNNNLIRIQKKYTILIIKQLSPFVSGGSPLLRNYYWILDFNIYFHFVYLRIPKIVLSMWGQWDVKQI